MSVAVYNHYKRVATDTMDEIEMRESQYGVTDRTEPDPEVLNHR